ncbi:putative Sensory transduction regulator [Azospirillaceae bacterium]
MVESSACSSSTPSQTQSGKSSRPETFRLDALKSLVRMAQSNVPLAINTLAVTTEGVPVLVESFQPSQVRFVIDTLLFNLLVSNRDGRLLCQIWAEVGYVPFSGQNVCKRQHVLSILRAAKDLPHAQFVLDGNQKILLFSQSFIEDELTPEAMIYETLPLIQEARPFLQLLAHNL